MRKAIIAATIILGLLSPACGQKECMFYGWRYNQGDMYTSIGGLQLRCLNGKMECMNCCDVKGYYHNIGATFTKDDGCNLCTCEARNKMKCTDIPC